MIFHEESASKVISFGNTLVQQGFSTGVSPVQSMGSSFYNLQLGSSKCAGLAQVSGMFHWRFPTPETLKTTALVHWCLG